MKALRHDETRRDGDQRRLGLQEPAKPVDADAPEEERQEVGGIAKAEDVGGQERSIPVGHQRQRQHQQEPPGRGERPEELEDDQDGEDG